MAVGPGHNKPPLDPAEIAAAAVDQLVANTEAWAEHSPVILDEATATACQTWLNQLTERLKDCKAKLAIERAPHDQALKDIQAKWAPLQRKLAVCIEAVGRMRGAWLTVKQRRLDAEREQKRREAAEAQQRAEQLAQAARAKEHGPGAVTNKIAAQEAAAEAQRAAKVAAAVPVRAQTKSDLGGRAASLRTYHFADVVDWEACWMHFHEDDPDNPGKRRPAESLRAELQRLANEQVRHGAREIPGCWIDKEER